MAPNTPAGGAERTAADSGKHAGSFRFACEELLEEHGDTPGGSLRGGGAGAVRDLQVTLVIEHPFSHQKKGSGKNTPQKCPWLPKSFQRVPF